MNLGDIIISVQRQFGDDTEAQITTEDITRWANDGQLEVARRTEALLFTFTESTVQGQREYPLPADFLRVNKVTWSGLVLSRTSSADMDKSFPTRDVSPFRPGAPNSYYVRNRKIYLFPVPDSVQDLVVEYNARPVSLVETDDQPSLPVEMHLDIVRYCLVRARELDGDRAGAKEAQAEFEARVAMTADESQNPYSDSYPSIRDFD